MGSVYVNARQDTALVLSRFNSIILARVFGHKDVEDLAELATVPGTL